MERGEKRAPKEQTRLRLMNPTKRQSESLHMSESANDALHQERVDNSTHAPDNLIAPDRALRSGPYPLLETLPVSTHT
jgi:hypothetical protein